MHASKRPPAENAGTLAALLVFVLVAGLLAPPLRIALSQVFLGYTPHYVATLFGLAAGSLAGRLIYRRVSGLG